MTLMIRPAGVAADLSLNPQANYNLNCLLRQQSTKGSRVAVLKRLVQETIRQGHLWFSSRPLPSKIGLYFHQIEGAGHDRMREMVSHFRGAGYRFVADPTEFTDPASSRVIFLSIDDNFRTSYELLPLADELKIRFTLYANTLFFSDQHDRRLHDQYVRHLENDFRGSFLSRKELIEISSRGHTIGAHTHSHRQLSALSHEEAVEEISACKKKLEQILEKSVEHFAYPFGMRRHFTEALRHYCRDNGFRTVANAIPGMQFCDQSPLSIQRSGWDLKQPLERNLQNLRIDGRLYEKWTGRSAVI